MHISNPCQVVAEEFRIEELLINQARRREAQLHRGITRQEWITAFRRLGYIDGFAEDSFDFVTEWQRTAGIPLLSITVSIMGYNG